MQVGQVITNIYRLLRQRMAPGRTKAVHAVDAFPGENLPEPTHSWNSQPARSLETFPQGSSPRKKEAGKRVDALEVWVRLGVAMSSELSVATGQKAQGERLSCRLLDEANESLAV